MSREQPEPGRIGPIVVVALLALLPLLYVLSFGPAAWLWRHGYVSQRLVDIIYFPLTIVARHSVWVFEALSWYARQFAG
jgi:hypothetical protein